MSFPKLLVIQPNSKQKFSSQIQDTAGLYHLLCSYDGPSKPEVEAIQLQTIRKNNRVHQVTQMLWKYKLFQAVIISLAAAF